MKRFAALATAFVLCLAVATPAQARGGDGFRIDLSFGSAHPHRVSPPYHHVRHRPYRPHFPYYYAPIVVAPAPQVYVVAPPPRYVSAGPCRTYYRTVNGRAVPSTACLHSDGAWH